MRQNEINSDLGHYIAEKKKSTPFWKRVKLHSGHKKEEEQIIHVDDKGNLERIEPVHTEQITPQDAKELEKMEAQLEEVNKIEEKVEEDIHAERESLLKKFFKKLNFSSRKEESAEEMDDDVDAPVSQVEQHESEKTEDKDEELTMNDSELREMLHGIHSWLTHLPEDKLEEFKQSKDFELYTKYLRKHNMIR